MLYVKSLLMKNLSAHLIMEKLRIGSVLVVNFVKVVWQKVLMNNSKPNKRIEKAILIQEENLCCISCFDSRSKKKFFHYCQVFMTKVFMMKLGLP